jgi:TRAP-type C4-dicarboxylate transport system permease small subunit
MFKKFHYFISRILQGTETDNEIVNALPHVFFLPARVVFAGEFALLIVIFIKYIIIGADKVKKLEAFLNYFLIFLYIFFIWGTWKYFNKRLDESIKEDDRIPNSKAWFLFFIIFLIILSPLICVALYFISI